MQGASHRQSGRAGPDPVSGRTLPTLVEYFVQRYARKLNKKISNVSEQTLKLFQTYQWPGNIRELQNVIEKSVILSEGDVFRVDECVFR